MILPTTPTALLLLRANHKELWIHCAAHILAAPVPYLLSGPWKNNASKSNQSLLAPDFHVDATEFIVNVMLVGKCCA